MSMLRAHLPQEFFGLLRTEEIFLRRSLRALTPYFVLHFPETLCVNERDHPRDGTALFRDNNGLTLYSVQQLAEAVLRLLCWYDSYFSHKSHCSYYQLFVKHAGQREQAVISIPRDRQ